MRVRTAVLVVLAARMFAGDGVHPLASASEYPVHQDLKDATLAATLVPADQVRKIFSADIARDWMVVEVAVFPGDGKSFDVDGYAFNLKIGDRFSRSENGVDVAGIGAPHGPDNRGPEPKVHVDQAAGIDIGHSNYPQGQPGNYPPGNYPAGSQNPQGQGPRTTVGTWESTTVSNYPQQPAGTASSSGPDPREMAARLREKELTEGIARQPVAGYLYFR